MIMGEVDMKSKLSSIILCFLMVFAVFLVVVPMTPSAGITIIVPDDYPTIQEAIDAANPGDTIEVWAGTYPEHLVVDKTLTLIGNGTANTTISGTGILDKDILEITADWVNVTGFKIINSQEWASGINLNNVNNCTIADNNCSNNKQGISLSFSSNNAIINNTFINNGGGIYIESSSNNMFTNNNCSFNRGGGIYQQYSSYNMLVNNTLKSNLGNGIRIDWSTNNYLINNTCVSNGDHNIFLTASSNNNIITENICADSLFGITLGISKNNTLFNNTLTSCSIFIGGNNIDYWNTNTIPNNNTVNGQPVIYWKNVNGGKVLANAGEVILGNCTNVIVENQNISNGTCGIEVGFSNNITVKNNTCSDHYFGIYQEYSSNCIFMNNTGYTNTFGIYLYYSENNTLDKNIYTNNTHGIYLRNSDNNLIINNNCSGNVYEGNEFQSAPTPPYNGIVILARIGTSNSNIVKNNTCLNNNNGIFLYGSAWGSCNNSIIENNTCSNNINGIVVIAYGYLWIFGGTCNRNTLTNNTCLNNSYNGIELSYTTNSTLKNNTMESCGVFISGNLLHHWNTHVIGLDNSVNGKPVHYWKNATGGTVPLDAGEVILANCTNVIIGYQNVSNGSWGIELGFSYNNTVKNNTCNSNNGGGLYLCHSSSNLLINNTYWNNSVGVYMVEFSINTITNSTITDSKDYDFYLSYSHATSLNTTFEDKVYINNYDTISTLTVQWYLGIYVKDIKSNLLANASIEINDAVKNSIFTGKTNSYGNIRWLPITEYVQQYGFKTYYTPHAITTTKAGYFSDYKQIKMNVSKEITIILDLLQPPVEVSVITGLQYGTETVEYDIMASVTENGLMRSHAPDTTLYVSIYNDEMNLIVDNDIMTVFNSAMGLYTYNNTTPDSGVYFVVVVCDIAGNYSSAMTSFEVVDWITEISDINDTVSNINTTMDPIIDLAVTTGLQYDTASVEFDVMVSVTENGLTRSHTPDTTLYVSIYNDEMNTIVANDVMNVFDAPMGLYSYNNTIPDSGVYFVEVVCNISGNYSLGMTSFEVVDWIGEISLINSTVSNLSTTIPVLINNLSNQLAEVRTTLLGNLSIVESNILTELANVNASLSLEIQNVLSEITGYIIDLNSSLTTQITNLHNNLSSEHTALRTWLETVLGAIELNLTETNKTLHQKLLDLDNNITAFYSSLYNDLVQLRAQMTLEHELLNDTINNLPQLDLSELSNRISVLSMELAEHNTSIAYELLLINSDIDAFKSEVDTKLAAIEQDLESLEKLDQILIKLDELKKLLTDLDKELKSQKEDSDGLDINTILLVIILVILAIMLLKLFLGKPETVEQISEPDEESVEFSVEEEKEI